MKFMVRFNTAPLVAPLTAQEIQALKQRRKQGEFGPTTPSLYVVGTIGAVALVCGQVFWAVAQFIGTVAASGDSPRFLWPLLLPLLTIVVICAAILFMVIRKYLRRQHPWTLLARFADVNGMRFGIRSADPRYPGLLFNEGHSRASTLHLFSPAGVLADVGGYQYVTGSGKNRTIHHWHFVTFRLPRPVPHLLLDAKANNMWKLTNLPKAFESSQRISLGEPFDSHYRLYAPEGYGRDAFQLLPPNVMEALLSAPVVYDIEMVDDWLFCYTQSQQDLTNPATWRLLEVIANGVLGSLAPVVGRYSDSHLPGQVAAPALYGPGTPMPVAPLGRRLRSGTSPGVILLVIGLIVLIGFFLFIQMTYILAR